MSAKPQSLPLTSFRLRGMISHELYKGRRQLFYLMVVVEPLVVSVLLVVLPHIIHLSDPSNIGSVDKTAPDSPRNLGYKGAFGLTNEVVIANYGMIFSFLIVVRPSGAGKSSL